MIAGRRSRQDAMNDQNQSHSQWPSPQHGGVIPEKVRPTTADPAAVGQSVFDAPDDGTCKLLQRRDARVDRARGLPPDSNAM
jgi:hypothetical protein